MQHATLVFVFEWLRTLNEYWIINIYIIIWLPGLSQKKTPITRQLQANKWWFWCQQMPSEISHPTWGLVCVKCCSPFFHKRKKHVLLWFLWGDFSWNKRDRNDSNTHTADDKTNTARDTKLRVPVNMGSFITGRSSWCQSNGHDLSFLKMPSDWKLAAY